jgi:hypothetical protein
MTWHGVRSILDGDRLSRCRASDFTVVSSGLSWHTTRYTAYNVGRTFRYTLFDRRSCRTVQCSSAPVDVAWSWVPYSTFIVLAVRPVCYILPIYPSSCLPHNWYCVAQDPCTTSKAGTAHNPLSPWTATAVSPQVTVRNPAVEPDNVIDRRDIGADKFTTW